MARARQVRLDDDVAVEADRRADGRSTADTVNRELRRAWALRDDSDIDRPVQRASIGRAAATRRPGSCAHPPERRRGAICMACGKPVPRR